MTKDNEKMRWLLENFGYIDSVTAIDNTGKVIVKKRYNPRYSEEENLIDNEWALNKNLLEVFPSLNYNDSSLLLALATGKIVCFENQEVWNHAGRRVVTNNITFPIVSRGEVVGAVELSKDVTHLEKFYQIHESRTPLRTNRPQSGAKYNLSDIITRNPAMEQVKKMIVQIANSKSSVLVYGETGTGKELVVSAIHNSSYRKNKPFVPVNCAALPENILEGILFGSRKGAFTGAENKKGLFEEANGGTIYLDEINSMPVALQAKILRVLQEKTVMPLGESKLIEVDVRVIASTNQPVEKLIETKAIREDLLYRLNTISITIPPLRQRPDDVEILAKHFIKKYNEEFEKGVQGMSDEALAFLMRNSWKGNVRELEHAIEAAMNVMQGETEICLKHLPASLTTPEPQFSAVNESYEGLDTPLTEAMESYEKRLILRALRQSRWKIVDAAKRLQIPRTSLQYKIEKYGIKKTENSQE